MTVVRKAGSIKQGYWFGNNNTTVYLDVIANWVVTDDLDSDNLIPYGTDTWTLMSALSEFGTVVYVNHRAASTISIIFENFKYPLNADGTIRSADRTEMINYLTSVVGDTVNISSASQTGAWVTTDRSGAAVVAAYGDGFKSYVDTHS